MRTMAVVERVGRERLQGALAVLRREAVLTDEERRTRAVRGGRGRRTPPDGKGLTLGELAARTGGKIRSTRLSDYQTGAKTPSDQSLAVVLAALNVNETDLLKMTEEPMAPSTEQPTAEVVAVVVDDSVTIARIVRHYEGRLIAMEARCSKLEAEKEQLELQLRTAQQQGHH